MLHSEKNVKKNIYDHVNILNITVYSSIASMEDEITDTIEKTQQQLCQTYPHIPIREQYLEAKTKFILRNEQD